MYKLKIVPSRNIETDKWDRCISDHANGLIYSTTTYLNSLAENWHGLVINDYEAVMPLPWKKKAGIRYYYLPPFIQQLGLTGHVPDHLIQAIVETISGTARYGDLHFNFSNTAIANTLPVTTRVNFLIDLDQPYEEIRNRYHPDAKELISKTETQQLIYQEGSSTAAIALYHDLYYDRMPRIKEKDYARFSTLCKGFSELGKCITRNITDDKGNILCTMLLLSDEKRIYNIVNAITKKGREKKANYLLFDRVIREFAGTERLFDLEGSELAGVKKFYQKFGVVNQPYFHYHHNRLPALIKLFYS